eukprot:COSAG02_NODE_59145_length_275_cov_0.585227_1_plen_74_part_01
MLYLELRCGGSRPFELSCGGSWHCFGTRWGEGCVSSAAVAGQLVSQDQGCNKPRCGGSWRTELNCGGSRSFELN